MSQSFQDPHVIKILQTRIRDLASHFSDRKIKICHVCGTHEYTISHWGLRSLLPKNVEVIAGPGCPVCVCPNKDIEQSIWLSKNGFILTTFGDMTRVPSNSGSLISARAEGGDVRVVYSFLDAIKLAKKNQEKKVVFFAIGFETTSPMVAIELINQNIPPNLYILSSYRLVPPAMHLLMEQPDFSLNGFIAPGHVSSITGSGIYESISSKYRVPIVVAGFEPVDVMLGIVSVLEQMKRGIGQTENLYTRVVTREGNKTALNAMSTAFDIIDANWRGIGTVPKSGFELASAYESFNIRKLIDIPVVHGEEIPKGCRCADVILGKAHPEECSLFKRICTPESPIGPCMVGNEGTCAIHAKYGGYFSLDD